MNIKSLVTNVRTYIYLVGIVVIALVSVSSYAKLPKVVEKAKEEIVENKDKVNKLAVTIDKYIMRQEVLQDAQERREELMLKLIEAR